MAEDRVEELKRLLELRAHPEGGHYAELWRSRAVVQPADMRPPRRALTSIYFLLATGERSRLHAVQSDEVWHHYEGDALELVLVSPDFAHVQRHRLDAVGPQARPVAVVPAGWWQAARPLGAYTLAGCSVGPGFEFADFQLLADQPGLAARLRALQPALEPFL